MTQDTFALKQGGQNLTLNVGKISKAMGYISPIPKGGCLRPPFFYWESV